MEGKPWKTRGDECGARRDREEVVEVYFEAPKQTVYSLRTNQTVLDGFIVPIVIP
jgi:hypothetical protein